MTNTTETVISFQQANYTFSEDIGIGRVCLERSGYTQEQNDIRITGGMTMYVKIKLTWCLILFLYLSFLAFNEALQEGTIQILSEVVSFLPTDVENKKCVEISVVDDDVALEAIEEWTFRLQTTENLNYVLGDNLIAIVQVIDDDGMEIMVL